MCWIKGQCMGFVNNQWYSFWRKTEGCPKFLSGSLESVSVSNTSISQSWGHPLFYQVLIHTVLTLTLNLNLCVSDLLIYYVPDQSNFNLPVNLIFLDLTFLMLYMWNCIFLIFHVAVRGGFSLTAFTYVGLKWSQSAQSVTSYQEGDVSNMPNLII